MAFRGIFALWLTSAFKSKSALAVHFWFSRAAFVAPNAGEAMPPPTNRPAMQPMFVISSG